MRQSVAESGSMILCIQGSHDRGAKALAWAKCAQAVSGCGCRLAGRSGPEWGEGWGGQHPSNLLTRVLFEPQIRARRRMNSVQHPRAPPGGRIMLSPPIANQVMKNGGCSPRQLSPSEGQRHGPPCSLPQAAAGRICGLAPASQGLCRRREEQSAPAQAGACAWCRPGEIVP